MELGRTATIPALEQHQGCESRSSTRVTLAAEIECSGEAGSFRSRFGDLSTGGMFVEFSRTPFTTGAVVTVRFALPGSSDSVVAESEVRYVHEGIGIGLRFLDLKPEDHERIHRFVEDAAAQRLPRREEEMRRTSRVSVNVRVTLRGTGADGIDFEEQTDIVTLSKNGACLLIKGPIRVGMKVGLSTARGLAFKASVVWLGDASRPQSRGQFGVQSRGLAQALGFQFP